MILALLLACGPKINPLQPMERAIEKAKRAGPTSSAHLRFVMAETTMQDLVLEVISPDKPIIMPVMLGTMASIRVDLDRPTLGLATSKACDCTVADVAATGRLDVEIGGLLGKHTLADDLGFSARVLGSPSFDLKKEPDGRTAIQMSGSDTRPWTVELELEEERGFLTNKLVDNSFEKPVAAMLQKSITIARLPATMPIIPVLLQLQPGKAPTVDVWLAAESSAPAPPIEVETGWGLSLTDTAALALMRTVLVDAKQHKTWKLEPLSMKLRDDRFEAVIRVHRVSRREQYRDYDVQGVVKSEEAGFNVVPETVVEINKHGWNGSLIGGFVTPQVRKRILEQKVLIPRTFETKDDRLPTRWTIRSLKASETGIFIHGDLEVLDGEETP